MPRNGEAENAERQLAEAAARARRLAESVRWPAGPLLGRAVRDALALAAAVGWPVTHKQQFWALYNGVMDTVRRRAGDRNTDVESVQEAYRALMTGGPHLTSHEELMRRTGMDYHDARQAAAVLSDVGDLHECYNDDWELYWARCDDFIKERCEERRISLCRYFEMYDILTDFQDKVVGWYVRRNRRQQQPFSLRGLKEEYVHRIQEEHFPDKPVGDKWSRHIAARYLRTAQDSIERSFDLTY